MVNIKTQNNLRIRVKYKKTFKSYNLRLQKRFFCFWLNTECFVDIKEAINKEERPGINPLTLSYMEGGSLEIYEKGTMNINERANKLYADYLKEQSIHTYNKNVLANSTN